MEEGTGSKPRCRLSGEDGNVYAIIGRVKAALRGVGLNDQASEFQKKAMACGSYDEVLALCDDYVEVE